MADIKLQIDPRSLQKIQQTFAKVSFNAQKKLIRKAVKAGGAVLEEEVKRRCPRGSKSGWMYFADQPKHPEYGHLQDQINMRVQVKDTWAAARINTGDAFWALFLEYGSGKPNDPYDPNRAGPHAFMRPALDAKGEEAFDTAAQTVSDNLSDLVD